MVVCDSNGDPGASEREKALLIAGLNEDHLHLALADNPDPMTYVGFPLGAIPMDLCRTPPAERRARSRRAEVAKFWAIAYPRKRHWVDNLRSMWTNGWNSQYPGKPAFSRQRVVSDTAPHREPAKDIESPKTAIRQWVASPRRSGRL